MIHITLPFPISVNKAFAGYPRRHKSNEYVAWEKEAERAMRTQLKYEIEGDEWLALHYTLYTNLHYKNGGKKRIDGFNYEKIAIDFLTKKITGFEDHKILTGSWDKREIDEKWERIEIFIEEVNP